MAALHGRIELVVPVGVGVLTALEGLGRQTSSAPEPHTVVVVIVACWVIGDNGADSGLAAIVDPDIVGVARLLVVGLLLDVCHCRGGRR